MLFFSCLLFSNLGFLRSLAVGFDDKARGGSTKCEKPYHLWFSCWGIFHTSPRSSVQLLSAIVKMF